MLVDMDEEAEGMQSTIFNLQERLLWYERRFGKPDEQEGERTFETLESVKGKGPSGVWQQQAALNGGGENGKVTGWGSEAQRFPQTPPLESVEE